MWSGYMALGSGQFGSLPNFELLNTQRLMRNVAWWNTKAANPNDPEEGCINWLANPDPCEGIEPYLTRAGNYCGVELSPNRAPWYDSRNPDSKGFLGVMGIDISGADDSVRSADVKIAVTGGGLVGRLRYGPRTLVVRALAVAIDDCAMEVGLTWLRAAYTGSGPNSCAGDNLWFFDCCPACAEEFWEEDCFIMTPGINPAPCFDKYVREYRGARVVNGPIVLSRRSGNTPGVFAEIEFTIIVPDPVKYTVSQLLVGDAVPSATAVAVADPPAAPPATPDPFDAKLGVKPVPFTGMQPRTLPRDWLRTEIDLPEAVDEFDMDSVFQYEIHADVEFGEVRIAVVDEHDEVLDGFLLPFIPAGSDVIVDGLDHAVYAGNGTDLVTRSGYVCDLNGSVAHTWTTLPPHDGKRKLRIDTTPADKGKALHVAVQVAHRERVG